VTIVEFLIAQLDEAETLAQRVAPLAHIYDTGGNRRPESFTHSRLTHATKDGSQRFEADQAASEHFDAWSPAFVLAEVVAKRRIVALHKLKVERLSVSPFDPITGEPNEPVFEVECEVCQWAGLDPTGGCDTLRLLALPLADRPGYDEAWRL
jgi:hypothetical protein